jgi:6-phosphogluconolactonase
LTVAGAAAALALAPQLVNAESTTNPELQSSQGGTLAGKASGAFTTYQISQPTAAPVTITLTFSPFDAVWTHAIGLNIYQGGKTLASATGLSQALHDATNSTAPSVTVTPSAGGGAVLVQVFNYSPDTISFTLTYSSSSSALSGTPTGPMPTSTAQARYVYVGTYTAPNTAPGGTAPSTARGIYVFKLDPSNGALTQIQVVTGIENPSWVTLDPQQKHLYATSEVSTWKGTNNSGGITAFSIDPGTGMLTKLNDQPTMGAIPAEVQVDPTGRYAVIANYNGANYSVLPIRSDGSLGPATDVFKVSGMGPIASRQEAPHPHDMVFDPAGRFLFGSDLGSDKLWVWNLNLTTGKLTPTALPYVQVASGSGPRHLTFHPSGKFLYVIAEMASSITAYSYDASRGAATWVQTVSTLPPDFAGTSTTAEIIMHPSGRFVYGSNRGHDTIAGFAIDQKSGKLTLIGWTPIQGQIPRGFNIDPSGSLLLAGGQNSNTLAAFLINPTTGALTPTGVVTQTPTPVSIQFGRTF